MKESNLEKLDLSFLPDELAALIKERLKKALAGLDEIKWPIKAVVLGGGYKNREITYIKDKVGSDIDLFIFSNFIPLFWNKLTRIQDKINNEEGEHFFHYRGVIPFFMSKSKTFWAYKLKHEGFILKGDENILKKIKATEDNIPKIEAIRILFQTLVVWLKIVELKPIEERNKTFTILRTYLNIGESCLTFFGHLKPSYKERLEEFRAESSNFGISASLRKKIILGYLTKVKPVQVSAEIGNIQLSLTQAKKDCVFMINYLLSLYLKTRENVPLEEKLEILSKEVPVKPFFNIAFFTFLKKRLGQLNPRFFPLVFRFKITDLWKIALFYELGKQKELSDILINYFSSKKIDGKDLIKMFESHPTIATVEIT